MSLGDGREAVPLLVEEKEAAVEQIACFVLKLEVEINASDASLGDFEYVLKEKLEDYLRIQRPELDGVSIISGWSTGSSSHFPSGIEYRPSTKLITTWLELVKYKDVYLLYAAGPSIEVLLQEVEMWRYSVSASIDTLSRSAPARRWNAVIGVDPSYRHSRSWRFASEVRIGNIAVKAAEQYMMEGRTGSEWWGMEINSAVGTWPVVVEGTVRTENSQRVDSLAMPHVFRLCGLFSLALQEPWIPRGRPWDLTVRRWIVPSKPQGTPEWIVGEDNPTSVEADIGAWLSKAWELLERRENAYLGKSMQMFREGMLVVEHHPSLALVAFSSALEAVASKRYKSQEQRCECCNQIKGSTSRFTELLVHHLGEERAKWFADQYRLRSKTVHGSQLFGGETIANAHITESSLVQGSDEHHQFEGELNFNFARITRQIILAELGADAPNVDPWQSVN